MPKQIILSNSDYEKLCELAGVALFVQTMLQKWEKTPPANEEVNSLDCFIDELVNETDSDIVDDIDLLMTDFDF